MSEIIRLEPSGRSLRLLSLLTFVAGAGGMALSYLFLASSHDLDVLAGAAGFVAGSVLAAAGLLAMALLARPAASTAAREPDCPPAAAPPQDVARWLAHFAGNRANRPEPDWAAPVTLDAEVVQPLVRSLEQFQLGDGGGPAYLIARDRERFLSGPGTRRLVDLWFAEEREHSRLLGAAVARFGGRCIQGHWSFTAFCLVRRWFGVRFELTVLLLTEIASTAYYRLLRRHGRDPALRAMCRLILRDESGHIAFHRDRLAAAARAGLAHRGWWWGCRFRALGLAAATMLWVNHAAGLCALGATRAEFYREVSRELSRFLRRLAEESQGDRQADRAAWRRMPRAVALPGVIAAAQT
jgi:hypothetical protein